MREVLLEIDKEFDGKTVLDVLERKFFLWKNGIKDFKAVVKGRG